MRWLFFGLSLVFFIVGIFASIYETGFVGVGFNLIGWLFLAVSYIGGLLEEIRDARPQDKN